MGTRFGVLVAVVPGFLVDGVIGFDGIQSSGESLVGW